MNAENAVDSPAEAARHESLWSGLRALPRPAWMLFFGTFLNKFGAFVVPFLTLYLTSCGCTVGETGLAVGAYGVGNLLASLLGGYLADYIGRRKTIVLSMFSGAAAMMLLSQAHSFPLILVLVLLTGLTNEFYRPASAALLTDVVPASRRITAFATLRMAFNAGFAFGPATAGFLAVYGFFWLFAGDAATSVLYGLVALVALPRITHASQANAGWGAAWSVLRRDHKLHQLLLANFAIGFVFCQTISTFALYVRHLGFSPSIYGVIISMNGAMVVLMELPLTTITRKFPPRRVMAVGYTLVGLGFGLNGLAHTVPALIVCMVIFTLGEIITMPTSFAYLANLAPADMRGRYMGVSGLTWSTALIVGPATGMKIFTANPTAYWIMCVALALFAAIVISGTKKESPLGPSLAKGTTANE